MGKCGQMKRYNHNYRWDMFCIHWTSEGVSYYIQQQRLLSAWVLNILLTSRYKTASRLDLALQGENSNLSKKALIISLNSYGEHILLMAEHILKCINITNTDICQKFSWLLYLDWTSPLSMILCLISFMCIGRPASSKTIYITEKQKQCECQTLLLPWPHWTIINKYLSSIEPCEVWLLWNFTWRFTANRHKLWMYFVLEH